MRELMISLCAAAFLSVMAEALLPEGSFQKYAHMVIGLFILLIMINTLITHRGASDFQWEMSPEVMSAEAAVKEQEAQVLVEYRRRLEEQIESSFGIAAHVEIGGEMEITSIFLEGNPSEEVCRAIAQTYGIERQQVRGNMP